MLAAVVGALALTPSGGAVAREAGAAAPVRPGLGSFVFDGYPPLAHRPVPVYYSAPADPSRAEIVVVMHGLGRDGRAHRDDWARLVGDRNVLVLVPELGSDGYPGGAYNVGNVVDGPDGSGVRQPPEQWTFHLVEALFDTVRADLGNDAATYGLFGFSGGAQFVHRFVELMPRHRARVAVAANAGWYTMPDDTVPFPHGLGGAPVGVSGLRDAFATSLVVILGGRDVDPQDPSLKRDALTDRQGRHRLERGRAFFGAAQRAARTRSFPFAWRLHEVPSLAHSHPDAARAALPFVCST